MDLHLSTCSFDELREMQSRIDAEINQRKRELKEKRFNAMMEAINAFFEVSPYTKLITDEYGDDYVSRDIITDRDNWIID